MNPVRFQQVLTKRGDVDRCQPETAHYDTADHAAFAPMEPLERRRCCCRVGESDAGPHANSKPEHPAKVRRGLGYPDEAQADQETPDHCRDTRPILVLYLSANDHHAGEHDAADGIGIIERRSIPLEGIRPFSLDGLFNSPLEQAPRIKHAQRQVNPCPGSRDDQALPFLQIRHRPSPKTCKCHCTTKIWGTTANASEHRSRNGFRQGEQSDQEGAELIAGRCVPRR